MNPAAVVWFVFAVHLFCALALFIKSAAWSRDAVEETEWHEGEWR